MVVNEHKSTMTAQITDHHGYSITQTLGSRHGRQHGQTAPGSKKLALQSLNRFQVGALQELQVGGQP